PAPRSQRVVDADAHATALARLITYGDGGRADVFIDRYLDRWNVAAQKRPPLRRSIRQLQIALASEVEVANRQTEQALAVALGSDSFRELNRLVLLREDNDPIPPTPTEEEIEKSLEV